MLFQTTPASAFMQINFLLLAGVIAGFVLFWRGFGILRRKRFIEDVPTSTIRGAALGPVEIGGTATGEATLVSPLSQLDCYYYQLTASTTKKVAEESLCVPFYLDDETGRLLVDPKGAELDITPAYSQQFGETRQRSTYGITAPYVIATEANTGDAVRHFLARHGLKDDEPLIVEERCVKPGDRLFVLGTLCENSRDESENRTAYISASAAGLQREVALSSSLHESETRYGHSRPIPKFYDKPTGADAEPVPKTPVVLMKGTTNPTFLISSFSQRQILEELRWKTPLYIFGGPALTLFCLWNLFSRFGVI
jgi:hypothetical protein